MIENIKILLGDAAANYSDELIRVCYENAVVAVEAYCNRTIDKELEYAAQKITIIMLNRMNTEGLNSQSFNGVSESYLDGYPADIQALLNRKRKVKIL